MPLTRELKEAVQLLSARDPAAPAVTKLRHHNWFGD